MRRAGFVSIVISCMLAGAFAAATPPAFPAAPITVPPTVNATSWSEVSVPSSAPGTFNALEGVSCTSSTFCMATGQTGAANGSLIEMWNGTSWSVVANPPFIGGLVLRSVSCVATSFCAAVGTLGPGILIEQWNGTAWSVVVPPLGGPLPPTPSELQGVSCTTSTDCVAVGSVTSGAGTVPLVEQWNGTSWTMTSVPNPGGSTNSALRSVSCSGASFCAAVGDSVQGSTTVTLAEQWNGSAWSIASSPNGSGASGAHNTLVGISCAGSSVCQAVGSFGDGVNAGRTLVESWDGATWAVVPSPNVSPGEADQLSGVDCFSATTCSAVGQSVDPSTGFDPLELAWNGSTWSVVPNPSLPSGSVQTSAGAVSCVTDWACVAVGATNNAGIINPFAMSAPIARSGYRFVATDGGVFNYGAGAPFLGSMGGTPLNKPVVGMAVMSAGDGYDLVASDGGIFNFGSAQFYGSTGSIHLNMPVVGMALTADGAGYWLVASDGGIFSYGDAQFYGSTGSIHLNKPIVGMAATPDGKGYWLVASDGGIFNYGDAAFLGSAGSLVLNKPVVGMAAPVSGGYYLVATDGGIFSYPTSGGPPFFGSTGSLVLNKPIVAMTAVAGGYYLSGSDGGVFAYPTAGGPPFLGSTGSIHLNAPIVGIGG